MVKENNLGWSRDISENTRYVANMNKELHPDLKTHVKFPPSPLYRYCNDQPCDNPTWSGKVGGGKFKVTVYVGDPNRDTKEDLKVNGEYYFDNVLIPKGKLKNETKIIESINDYITVSSDCRTGCESA